MNLIEHDLEIKQYTLAELERTNLRRTVVEERRRFDEVFTCLKPVSDSQTAIFNDACGIEPRNGHTSCWTFEYNYKYFSS
ncbi:hypothetical protein PHET_12474 [Paragonimus heterotremus]|uniref:Uncharacterized protein n=1 Tax=Paragonimus heterotremus TaxID=100268 RepID=A0A8J4WCZ9_9TREM|nr:hypothetical protein PHET_12474 [Paragonimus heterotremus]